MTNKEGQTTHVLLNDGLSQIWEIKNKSEAERISRVLNQNSDSGWVYTIRETCDRK